MSRDFKYENIIEVSKGQSEKEIIRQYKILAAEANTVREKDKGLIKDMFSNFYNKSLDVGIGFQRAYGAILSGDYFDLIHLPDGNYLFVFADISGHGLLAYTTLIRLRSAITLGVNELYHIYERSEAVDPAFLVKNITKKFTDVMDNANSHDFACINFTFIYNEGDKFLLRFFNRSMLFPLVVRKYNSELVNIYNLNREEKGWMPAKGYLAGSDVSKLLDERYYETPSCDFVLYEGDSILFFSDGIIEAYNKSKNIDEFGIERIEEILLQNLSLSPQEIIDLLFERVYEFIGDPKFQKDDMTAVMIDFPPVR